MPAHSLFIGSIPFSERVLIVPDGQAQIMVLIRTSEGIQTCEGVSLRGGDALSYSDEHLEISICEAQGRNEITNDNEVRGYLVRLKTIEDEYVRAFTYDTREGPRTAKRLNWVNSSLTFTWKTLAERNLPQ